MASRASTSINHDLALALVATCKQLRIGLDEPTPQHRDYIAVNATLEQVHAKIKDRFTTGAVADVDVVASWSVARARDGAWVAAQMLEHLDGNAMLRKAFLADLARRTGFAGRLLLARTS